MEDCEVQRVLHLCDGKPLCVYPAVVPCSNQCHPAVQLNQPNSLTSLSKPAPCLPTLTRVYSRLSLTALTPTSMPEGACCSSMTPVAANHTKSHPSGLLLTPATTCIIIDARPGARSQHFMTFNWRAAGHAAFPLVVHPNPTPKQPHARYSRPTFQIENNSLQHCLTLLPCTSLSSCCAVG